MFIYAVTALALTNVPIVWTLRKYAPYLIGEPFSNILASNTLLVPVISALPVVAYLCHGTAYPTESKKMQLTLKIWLTTGALYSILCFRPLFGARWDWLTERLLLTRVRYQGTLLCEYLNYYPLVSSDPLLAKRVIMRYYYNILETHKWLEQDIELLLETDLSNVSRALPDVHQALQALQFLASESITLADSLDN